MTARTTLAKRDANTLVAESSHVVQDSAVKRQKKTAVPKQDDEFDNSDQELDDEALIAAAEEVESAVPSQTKSSTHSQDAASITSPPTSSSLATVTPTPKAGKSATSAPRSTLRQATLFPSSQGSPIKLVSSSSSTSSSSPAVPDLNPPEDPLADPLWLERQTMSPAWYELLLPEMQKPYFSSTLKSFLAAEDRAGKKTYPPPALIYSWSRLVPSPRHVRIVVVGQDPYHGPNQACGLSFSVNKGVAIPPSLRNIYKELGTEYPGSFKAPTHGCLDGWAQQGVLMLNACLTVSAGAAASHHGKGWEGLTKVVLRKIADEAAASKADGNAVATSKIATMFAKAQGKPISTTSTKTATVEKKETESKEGANEEQVQCKGVVFLVWGAPAAKTLAEAGVTEKSPNVLILKSPHPSPLSAHRGFLGNGHFKKANEWLKSRYGEEGMIDWSRL